MAKVADSDRMITPFWIGGGAQWGGSSTGPALRECEVV